LNKNNNILSNDLQSFAVTPPSFLFDKITSRIEEENVVFGNKLKSLFNHSVEPSAGTISFGSIMSKIKETDQLNQFKPLRDFEVTAPFSFARLMEIIRSKMVAVPASASTSARVIPMGLIKRIAAAAAVLALCYIGYLSFQNKNVNSNPDVAATNNNIPPVVNNNITPATVDTTNTVLPTTSTQIASIAGNRNKPATNNVYAKSFVTKQKGRSDFSKNIVFGMGKEPLQINELNIGGSNVTILDNDYLATFASLNEANLPAFLQAEKPVATVITIDDYTDITISENMGAMMKKMYKTKKSGKPTRRARKTKEKLEKWKIADSTFFNPNNSMNPLNPFDLGNFILIK
jgi:hypothetical protein